MFAVILGWLDFIGDVAWSLVLWRLFASYFHFVLIGLSLLGTVVFAWKVFRAGKLSGFRKFIAAWIMVMFTAGAVAGVILWIVQGAG